LDRVSYTTRPIREASSAPSHRRRMLLMADRQTVYFRLPSDIQ
jgi:hypothetical protein